MGDQIEPPSFVAPEDDPDQLSDVALVELLPGVHFALGEISKDLQTRLELEPIDLWLSSREDRESLSTVLTAIGSASTVAGNVANAAASAQGLYRLSASTQAAIRAGATLAAKDGANLGALISSTGLSQARFIPVAAVNAASLAASVGPALAMMGLQLMLGEVSSLLKTTNGYVHQVLADIRRQQQATNSGLVDAVDRALDQARRVESVPTSLWETIAPSEAALLMQRDLFRRSVTNHVGKIDELEGRELRDYLDGNAETIVFDTFAVLSSLRAWTGYQALRAARALEAGADDPNEARLFDIITTDVPLEVDSALGEVRRLVDSLHRRLRVLTSVDEGRGWLSWKGRDGKSVRRTATDVLRAIEPLVHALGTPTPPLDPPPIVCAPVSLDIQGPLRILRWVLDPREAIRALGVADPVDTSGSPQAMFRSARREVVDLLRRDAEPAELLVVTDRRILTARTDGLLTQGEVDRDLPLADVRYVRAVVGSSPGLRMAVDLITREENHRWLFAKSADPRDVGRLAGVLAEYMVIPDEERSRLQQGEVTEIAATTEG